MMAIMNFIKNPPDGGFDPAWSCFGPFDGSKVFSSAQIRRYPGYRDAMIYWETNKSFACFLGKRAAAVPPPISMEQIKAESRDQRQSGGFFPTSDPIDRK